MLLKLFVLVLVVATGAGLVLRLYMNRSAEDTLRPGERVTISMLTDPLPENAALACPPDYCRATALASPVFALPEARLVRLVREMVVGEAHTLVVSDEPAEHRIVAIQHTPLLRFPDIVTIEFVTLGPGRSSVAIYSHSRYGKGDLGTNQRRVTRWLEQIEHLAGQ
jgi:uncharacterized protein (DUF1499 family)